MDITQYDILILLEDLSIVISMKEIYVEFTKKIVKFINVRKYLIVFKTISNVQNDVIVLFKTVYTYFSK